MSEQLERRYQPERRAFHRTTWFRERRTRFDRRGRVAGLERRSLGRLGTIAKRRPE